MTEKLKNIPVTSIAASLIQEGSCAVRQPLQMTSIETLDWGFACM